MSRKGGTGGGGWVHLKGANSMATAGLSHELALDCMESGGPFLGF